VGYFLAGILAGWWLGYGVTGLTAKIRELLAPKPRPKADPGRIWKLERDVLDRD